MTFVDCKELSMSRETFIPVRIWLNSLNNEFEILVHKEDTQAFISRCRELSLYCDKYEGMEATAEIEWSEEVGDE